MVVSSSGVVLDQRSDHSSPKVEGKRFCLCMYCFERSLFCLLCSFNRREVRDDVVSSIERDYIDRCTTCINHHLVCSVYR